MLFVKHNCVMNPPKFCLFLYPALGPSTGEDTVAAFLRNLSQLALTHLETPGHDIVIDGAASNPAWYHEGLSSLRSHPKWTEPKSYFWCAGGVTLTGKPFKRRSKCMSTFELPIIHSWKNCCGQPFANHETSQTSVQCKQAKPCDRRYPPIVWKAFVSDITSHCKPTVTTTRTDLTVCGKQ